MNNKVYKVFNDQVQAELYSAYMYLAMSLYLEDQNFKGMAHWMRLQYEEEREHAFRLAKFMQERGVKPELLQIDAPPAEFGTPLEVFKKALEHEKYVTSRIHAMYEVAMEEKDYAAMTHLHWFIDEQVEEEDQTRDIVDRLAMVGDNMNGLFVVDGQLGARK
ncbi:MAG: ferritin [Phascolarctobacterium sp.]|nr:ferritin [Acidaminococcaceae bacterium]MBQ7884051.1 ferritin [Phascolarctobacterium sp.]MBQ8418399.1 ferritin [Phascolarctobacterium sp.]